MVLGMEHGMNVFSFKIFLTSLQVRADIINTLNITYSTLIIDSTFNQYFFHYRERTVTDAKYVFLQVNKVLY